MNYQEEHAGWRDRFGRMLDRVEAVYLKVLRAAVLVVATIMIAFAAWLAISGLYKMSRSPDSVEEKLATVQANEIIDAQANAENASTEQSAEPSATPAQRQFYREFVARYYDLYRRRFEPYRQAEDKRLSRDEFDDRFIDTEKRLAQVASNDLNFESDRDDLKSLLAVMTSAADAPAAEQRLQKYQSAKKVQVSTQVQRTRTETRSGWDSASTSCAAWYESPIGCPATRSVAVPYMETVKAMEFPKDTQSHAQIFEAFQTRYFELLGERRNANERDAENERNAITEGKIEGQIGMFFALQIVGAFLALMFFFLLIAVERHQRRMSAMIEGQARPREA